MSRAYQVATDGEAEVFRATAQAWFEYQNPALMFTDTKSTAIGAIMEFIANQNGRTLFESGGGKPITIGPNPEDAFK